jgi:hypothetical protein
VLPAVLPPPVVPPDPPPATVISKLSVKKIAGIVIFLDYYFVLKFSVSRTMEVSIPEVC